MQQPAFRWPTTPVMLTLLSQVSKDRFRECDSIFLQKLREEYQHQYDPDWALTLSLMQLNCLSISIKQFAYNPNLVSLTQPIATVLHLYLAYCRSGFRIDGLKLDQRVGEEVTTSSVQSLKAKHDGARESKWRRKSGFSTYQKRCPRGNRKVCNKQ